MQHHQGHPPLRQWRDRLLCHLHVAVGLVRMFSLCFWWIIKYFVQINVSFECNAVISRSTEVRVFFSNNVPRILEERTGQHPVPLGSQKFWRGGGLLIRIWSYIIITWLNCYFLIVKVMMEMSNIVTHTSSSFEFKLKSNEVLLLFHCSGASSTRVLCKSCQIQLQEVQQEEQGLWHCLQCLKLCIVI